MLEGVRQISIIAAGGDSYGRKAFADHSLRRSFRDRRYRSRGLRRRWHGGLSRDGRRGRGLARNADLAAVVNCGYGRSRGWIEALAGKIVDDLQRIYGVVRMLVGTVGGERIESVGDRDDARQKGNFVSLQAMRV